jgi:hypothetical protein
MFINIPSGCSKIYKFMPPKTLADCFFIMAPRCKDFMRLDNQRLLSKTVYLIVVLVGNVCRSLQPKLASSVAILWRQDEN